MNESQFLALKIKASTFKYTSLNYTSFENVCEYEILLDDCDIVLLYGYLIIFNIFGPATM